MYEDDLKLKEKELKASEFSRIFESIGKNVFWISLGGGEPFLRKDIVEICCSLDEHCSPPIVHILTNATMPGSIFRKTRQILTDCDFPILKVNLSLDGVGREHDEIRGYPGNFKKFLESYRSLKELKEEFPRLNLGIHTTVSTHNIRKMLEVYECIKSLEPDTFIFEIAEERKEFLNISSGITPTVDEYKTLIENLKDRIEKDYLTKRKGIAKITQALKLEYYKLSLKTLERKEQVLACYAGFCSCQINAFGDLWPCSMLAGSKSFGNLREVDYDFKSIWFSKKANRIRNFIKNKHCYCPLASVFYTNMLNFRTLPKVMRRFFMKR
jgi:MoaA/NifB/PqqE/SkfB family radical SAM enzyme